jgi:hypothetical protein
MKTEAELNNGLIEKKNWRQTPQYRTVSKVKSLNGLNVTYEVEEEYFVVDGKEMSSSEYFKWISNQDPHLWQHYWQKVQDYRYGAHITDEMAKCYHERYPDLQRAFNGNLAQLKEHWQVYGRNEKRIKFCYHELTDEEAQCYLDRFPDIAFTPLMEPNVYLASKKAAKPADATNVELEESVDKNNKGKNKDEDDDDKGNNGKGRGNRKGKLDKEDKGGKDKEGNDKGNAGKGKGGGPNKNSKKANKDASNSTADESSDDNGFGDGKEALPEYLKNPIQYAKDHYDYWGYFEQRNRYCSARLTEIQSKCYLNRYPDLVVAFGQNWKDARLHYYLHGKREGREFRCANKIKLDRCNGDKDCEEEALSFYDPKPVK